MLPEDLQQEFDRYLDLQNERATASEELALDQHNPERHRKYFLLQKEEHSAAYTFWQHVRDRFNLWTDPLVVRDGYEVVRALPPGYFTIMQDAPHD